MRTVKITFDLETEQIQVEQIAKMLDIHPYETRSVFPKCSIAKPWWSIVIKSDWLDIEEPIKIIRDMLTPKMDVIKDLMQNYEIDAYLIINVRADYADRPVMAIPAYLYPFLEDLNAELVFDVAYEW